MKKVLFLIVLITQCTFLIASDEPIVKAAKNGDLQTVKTILAVNALLRGYFRNEPYLPSGSTVHKSHSIFLLDLSTVSHTLAAKNAKRGLFFKYECVNV